jgi:hypothetical protein
MAAVVALPRPAPAASVLKDQIDAAVLQLSNYVTKLQAQKREVEREQAAAEVLTRANNDIQQQITGLQTELQSAQRQLKAIEDFQRSLREEGIVRSLNDLQTKLDETLAAINTAAPLMPSTGGRSSAQPITGGRSSAIHPATVPVPRSVGLCRPFRPRLPKVTRPAAETTLAR